MRSILERTISAYGAEGDDAFQEEEIAEFLNASYRKVISILSNMERNTGNVLRSLDELRTRVITNIDDTPRTENGYEVYDIEFPNGYQSILYMSYLDNQNDESRRVRELRTDQIVLLEMGNTRPNVFESFFHVVNTESDKIIELYTHESNNGDQVRGYYIKDVGSLDDNNYSTLTSLPDLPAYLTDAVIYGACEKMALKVEDASLDAHRAKFMSEIKNNAI